MSGATDKAYAELRGRLLKGVWSGGTPLREAELGTELGMSRTPVREALRRLAAEGLVDYHPNRGMTTPVHVLSDWEEIFDLRALLEPHAVWLAAKRIQPEEIQTLEELCSRMEEHATAGRSNWEEVSTLNAVFHERLLQASGSRRLALLVGSLGHALTIYRSYLQFSEMEMQRSMAHHREIVSALRAGDQRWAASAMRAHILAGKAKVRDSASVVNEASTE